RPDLRRAAERADHGEGAPHHQGARGRGLDLDREPPRRDGLLRRVEGRPDALPPQDPLRELQQRVHHAVAAARRVRAGHHHDPRVPLLHPGGHRPMTPTILGLELAYWQETTIRVLLGLAALLLLTGGVVYLYLFKFVSFMQSRLGPMEAGPYGSLQLLAEVGKWLQKEDITTENADKTVFRLAPAIVLASTFVMFAVIPAGPSAVIADLGTGIYFVLAMSGLSVVGILMAGWASANKYALLGAL